MFAFTLASRARSCMAMKLGIAIAARIPMITTTIISSIRVKPFEFLMKPNLLWGPSLAGRGTSDHGVWNATGMPTRVLEAAWSLTEPPGPVRLRYGGTGESMGSKALQTSRSMGSNTSQNTDAQKALDSLRRIVRALREAARSAELRFGVSGAQLFVLHK